MLFSNQFKPAREKLFADHCSSVPHYVAAVPSIPVYTCLYLSIPVPRLPVFETSCTEKVPYKRFGHIYVRTWKQTVQTVLLAQLPVCIMTFPRSKLFCHNRLNGDTS
jgi:hypothetical protein